MNDENMWKKWENNLHLVKKVFFLILISLSSFFWSSFLATADHRVLFGDFSEERFNLKSYYIYLVCSVYCVWFSFWLRSNNLAPQRTGRRWISEQRSYSRDVKIFLEVSNLRLLSSNFFWQSDTPNECTPSPLQWIFYALVDSIKLHPASESRERERA